MVTEILNYLKDCPYLSDFIMNVDFLGKNPHSLSVGATGDSKVLKKYTDGDSIEKETYKLRLRLPYGIDKEKNCENSAFLENISRWLSQRSAEGILPEMDLDKIAISAEITFKKDGASYFTDTAVYTADFAVIFYKANQKGSKL